MLTQEQVEQIARKYYPQIATAINAAFEEYMTVRREQSQTGTIDLKPRTCASLIHDLVKRKIREQLSSDPDVTIGEFNGIFGVLLQGQVFIRFKKFNDDLTTSNVQTNQTDNYNRQANFAGFGEAPTLLVAGYLPDSSWTSIRNIYLICRDGNGIIWQRDLTTEVKQLPIFAAENLEQTNNTRRVKFKPDQTGGEKTGTEDV